jgi:hypothetical protein
MLLIWIAGRIQFIFVYRLCLSDSDVHLGGGFRRERKRDVDNNDDDDTDNFFF